MAVEALVVQMRRRGPGQMLGIGDSLASAAGTFLDAVTGGQGSELANDAKTIKLMLEVSTLAAVVSGAAALILLFKRGGR
jgi:hypothetical protein